MSSSTLTNTSLTIAGTTAINGATSAGYINNINQNLGYTNISSVISFGPQPYTNSYQLSSNYRIQVLSAPLTVVSTIMLPFATVGTEIIIANVCTGFAINIVGNTFDGTYNVSNIFYNPGSGGEQGYFSTGSNTYFHFVYDGTNWGVIAFNGATENTVWQGV